MKLTKEELEDLKSAPEGIDINARALRKLIAHIIDMEKRLDEVSDKIDDHVQTH